MKVLRWAMIPGGLVALVLFALVAALPVNQARTQTAVTNLAGSFAASVSTKSSEQVAEDVAAWIAANPTSSRPANKTYEILVNGSVVQQTTAKILDLAQAKGGVTLPTRLGQVTAKLMSIQQLIGRKPPKGCDYMWEVTIPGLATPVFVCADSLFDFIDRVNDGFTPPGLG